MSSLLQLCAPFVSRLIYISDSPLRYFLFQSIVNNSRLFLLLIESHRIIIINRLLFVRLFLSTQTVEIHAIRVKIKIRTRSLFHSSRSQGFVGEVSGWSRSIRYDYAKTVYFTITMYTINKPAGVYIQSCTSVWYVHVSVRKLVLVRFRFPYSGSGQRAKKRRPCEMRNSKIAFTAILHRLVARFLIRFFTVLPSWY